MPGQQVDLLAKKIIAYFHDPPWKAWVIAQKLGGKGHEEQALDLLRDLGIDVKEIPEDVAAADRLSATIDRWIISELYEERSKGGAPEGKSGRESPEREEVKVIQFKLNVFDPKKRFRISGGVNADHVGKYRKALVDAVNGEKQELKYHLIYFLAPLLWYEMFPNAVPLADTRAPTHTIFDHATATAAMLNILECKGNKVSFKGSVAVIEVPSVQELISFSRKSRDLWASSWLTSALLWKAVEGFVERYGPDVVLRPELSLNHFFIAWLYNRSSKRDLVKKFAKKFAGLDGDPRISMMSEKVVLVLPEEDKEAIKRELRERFYGGWRAVADEVIGQWKGYEYIDRAIGTPPIEPIINVVSVRDAFRDFSEKLGVESPYCSGPFPLELSLFFEHIYRAATRYRRAKFSYGSAIADVVRKLTSQGDYKLCTVCGVLPSALYYYSTGDYLDDREKENVEDRLCPYCAVKRGLKGDRLVRVMEKLGLKVVGVASRFPSTSELAMADLAYHRVGGGKGLMEVLESAFRDPDEAERLCKCYSGNVKECQGVNLSELREHGNLYYAIIKADGDYMGSGYWSGNLKGYSVSSYITTIAEYLREVGAKEDIVKKLKESAVSVEDRLRKTKEKLGLPVGLPLTLAYAYALTRALTVQAVIDKAVLERNYAVPIYLGGDDILALSPVKFADRYSLLDALRETRRAYWRFADKHDADFDGFKSVNGLVVDSLRVYGRSYAVFVAHYRDPMTLSLSTANYLLELKDEVDGKDVAFISSGRGTSGLSYSVIKLSNDSGGLDLSQIDLVKEILEKLESKQFSNSLVYDLLGLDEYKREGEALTLLALRAIERNAEDKKAAEELKAKVREVIGKSPCNGEACKEKESLLNLIEAVSHLR